MQNTLYKIQNTVSNLQNTKYKIQNTVSNLQNTEYKIQNTTYKIQNTKYKIQEMITSCYLCIINFKLTHIKQSNVVHCATS